MIEHIKQIGAELEEERTKEIIAIMKEDLEERVKSYNKKHPKSPIFKEEKK